MIVTKDQLCAWLDRIGPMDPPAKLPTRKRDLYIAQASYLGTYHVVFLYRDRYQILGIYTGPTEPANPA